MKFSVERGSIMRKEISKYMKRLCDCGLTTSLGGNISCLEGDGIWMTPSSIDKYDLSPDDMVMLSLDGKVVSGTNKPSIESMMHVQIYEKRKDINAIIHAHPLYATMFSASNEKINIAYTAEALKNLKCIVLTNYESMGTENLAGAVSDAAVNSNVILMENHGIVTLGKNLLEAFYRMEILENAAKMTFYSKFLPLKEINILEQERLVKL